MKLFGLFGRPKSAPVATPAVPPLSPAEHWNHDRRLIAAWLLREAGGHFDHVETRGDGSTFIAFDSPIGHLTVHDYWSFVRPDFQAMDRAQSYSQILARQVPILTIGYARPTGEAAELVIFFNGEADPQQGAAQALTQSTAGRPAGALVALEIIKNPPGGRLVEPYADPFLASVIAAVVAQTAKLPGH